MNDDRPSKAQQASPGDSILENIAARTGRSPRVTLRDAGTGDAGPLIDPKASAYQDELSRGDQGKYRILGEIARGGMGVVLRGHDLELGREVALKVVDADLAKRPEVMERFVEEAQVGGQLQHPGIVPVYELGLMADERPYFTMKLVKGRTLAAMLTRRKSLEEDRARFLSIFEDVCQTLAYAHSKGVIHRDLKPANIMVGAFGEVQVVDWGLSKVLKAGGVADEVRARDTAMSVIETIRSGPGSSTDSMVGNVLGTPAYMSPEQAQGEIDKLDERTDVFALGAILCEILTGAGPYVGDESARLVQLAALAELDDARQRIEACTASAEIKKLCLLCLMPSRAARPRDAEEVAKAVGEHLAGLEERAHQERLNAERSRRQTQLAVFLGLFLVLAIGGGGGGWWWVDSQQRAREAEVASAFEEFTREVVEYERAGDFEQAVESARAGLRLVESGSAGAVLRERAQGLVRTSEERLTTHTEREEAEAREREILRFLIERPVQDALPGSTATRKEINDAYRTALREFGLDLDDPDVSEGLARYRDTPLGIELARGFDGWARALRVEAIRQGKDLRGARDEEVYELELVAGVGIDLDPDPTRTTIRQALVERDKEPVLELARSEVLGDLSAVTLDLLAVTLFWLGEETESLRVLTLATDRYPTDFRIQALAGDLFYLAYEADFVSAVSHLETAIALRPDVGGLYFRLAQARSARGDEAGSLQAARMAHRLLPDYEFLYRRVGLSALKTGRWESAVDYLSRSASYFPEGDFVANDLLKIALVWKGELSRDAYLDWVDSQGGSFDRAALTLSIFVPDGHEPEPERVLDLLRNEIAIKSSNVDVIMSVVGSYALLGMPDGLDAARWLEEMAGQERFYGTIAVLLQASIRAIQGDAEAAGNLLRRAEESRDLLYGSRRSEWAGGLIDMAFERLGPIARGR
jgi:serine/threonine-protein kinase